MYKSLVRPLLFSLDAEQAHHLSFSLLAASRVGPIRKLLTDFFATSHESLRVQAFGLDFANPLGLAAGFDKECRIPDFFAALGFGHIEIGTVTAHAQAGNPRPRIFRFPEDGALINRMGFPSDGLDVVCPRLKQARERLPDYPIGVNVGKSKVTPLDSALEDYLKSFERMKNLGSFFVLNVSSPNTPELRKLQEKPRLVELFKAIASVNDVQKPVLIKIAPDLSSEELDDVLDVALSESVSGLIATNTTLARDGLSTTTDQAGGLSGRPLHKKSLHMVQAIYQRTSGKIPVIGVGGVYDSHGVLRMIQAGASLVQIYTGLIYEGPFLVKRIHDALARHLSDQGISHISELRGVGIEKGNSSVISAA